MISKSLYGNLTLPTLNGSWRRIAAHLSTHQHEARRIDTNIAKLPRTAAARLERRPGTKNSKPERAGSKSYRVFSRLERTILDVQNAPRSQ